jgi:hypothetical protein
MPGGSGCGLSALIPGGKGWGLRARIPIPAAAGAKDISSNDEAAISAVVRPGMAVDILNLLVMTEAPSAKGDVSDYW